MNEIDRKRPDSNVLFDYVAITFPVDNNELAFREECGKGIRSLFTNEYFKTIMIMMGLNHMDYTDEGKVSHYDKMITYGEFIHFKYNGPVDVNGNLTHSLELKGEGCREVERLGIDWYYLLLYVKQHKLKLSTLHIACDIFHKDYFTIEQLLKKAKSKEYISWSRKFNYVESTDSGSKTGISLYFGRRDDNQVNIYDKKKERYYKGYEVDTNTWYRIEIRLKGSKSWDFLRLYAVYGHDSLPKLYFEVLAGMLEFKVKGSYQRVKLRPTWRSWERFLNSSDKIKLRNQAKLESGLVKKANWLKDSGGNTLLEIMAAFSAEDKEKLIKEVVNDKVEKINHKSLTRINQYRMTKGLDPFDSLEECQDFLRNHPARLI